jgi:hypothetical protein
MRLRLPGQNIDLDGEFMQAECNDEDRYMCSKGQISERETYVYLVQI